MYDHPEIPFKVELPVSFFEKADAAPDKQMRIGGIVSSEEPDLQGDTLIQKGLDFSAFLTNGWYNDNHSKETTALGYPESVEQFAKGETLPDGTTAKAACTWAEGYLLKGWEPAEKIWKFAKALQGTGRRLGFSVEGSILRRTGELRKTVAHAKVRNVAITGCPVNTSSGLTTLSKSLAVAESMAPGTLDQIINAGDLSDCLTNLERLLEKALTMGTPSTPGTAPTGPVEGEGAGQVLARESLDKDEKDKKKSGVKR